MPMKEEVDGQTETWKLGYLLETILTRDPWMHRVDIARATGRDLVLTPDHDGRIVADVVAEWARRHGQPFTLELTGPIGATYVNGDRRRAHHHRRRRVLPHPVGPCRGHRAARPPRPLLSRSGGVERKGGPPLPRWV
jgi:hypothetical protein